MDEVKEANVKDLRLLIKQWEVLQENPGAEIREQARIAARIRRVTDILDKIDEMEKEIKP